VPAARRKPGTASRVLLWTRAIAEAVGLSTVLIRHGHRGRIRQSYPDGPHDRVAFRPGVLSDPSASVPAVSLTSPAHPTRARLPRARAGTTTSFQVAGTELFVTANGQPDGTLGEVFAKFGKEGSTTAGLMDLLSIAISLGLQHGVPPETFVRKFKGMRFEPMGHTDDPEIPTVSSIGDYLARRIALDWLPHETRQALGIVTSDDLEPRQVARVVTR
jgi:hypothetical protein